MADCVEERATSTIKRSRFRSGNICCAVNCSNREGKSRFSFYRIPTKDKGNRSAWIRAISRGGNWKPSKHSRLCSEHFVSGRRSKDPASPNYIPRIFSHKKPKITSKRTSKTSRRLFAENEENVCPSTPCPWPQDINTSQPDAEEMARVSASDCVAMAPSGIDVNSQYLEDEVIPELAESPRPQSPVLQEQLDPSMTGALLAKIAELECQKKELEETVLRMKNKLLTLDNIKDDPNSMRYYTGFVNYGTFMALFQYLEPKANAMKYWYGKTSIGSKHYTSSNSKAERKLSKLDEFFMVMVRLRLGILVKDISTRFGITPGLFSRIFTTWINLLYHELSDMCQFTSQEKSLSSMPGQFRNFPNTRVIIDCTELFTQRPSSLEAQRQTFSNYKHHNTFKFLVGISTNGAIIYVSRGWGGRASDKHITRNSDFLGNLDSGDQVMADRGFDIEAELTPLGARLVMPSFKGSHRSQLSPTEVMKGKRIAEVRIHVERAIGRIKNFHFLDTDIKLSMKDVAEQIFTVCAFLTNFQAKYVS